MTDTNPIGKILTSLFVTASFLAPVAAAASDDISFKVSPNINNWWVEVSTDRRASSVTASVDGGPAVPLKHEWWGGWGVSTHVQPGSRVVFTATVDSKSHTSGSYTWPDKTDRDRDRDRDRDGDNVFWGDRSTRSSYDARSAYTFRQRVDIPPDNVIAALALANSGYFGRIGISDIANIDRSATSEVSRRTSSSIDTQDALVLLALGGDHRSLGGYGFGFGVSNPVFGQCLQERALVSTLGLGTEGLYRC